ncbi:phospholipase A1-like [Periplaneta americana]|uniref:phospholipase A1-like n=1 Tax=Periplaneta americana TaxID=6978 RepID=UPI0037E75ECB
MLKYERKTRPEDFSQCVMAATQKKFRLAALLIYFINYMSECAAVSSWIRSADEDDVCFDQLGCFSTKAPWVTFTRPLPPPEDPNDAPVTFFLFTRSNVRQPYVVVTWPDIDMTGSGFDEKRTTVFIVHGYQSSATAAWLRDMKNAMLQTVDANVFLVDWAPGSISQNYAQAASNTRVVGAEMTRLGQYLIDKLGASPARFHVIGHSLGAHVAGFMAKKTPDIGRVTGLDPAQPLFDTEDPTIRLDSADAVFVEVVHTDAKPAFPLLGVGIFRALGDVDFYMNGGWAQPGCEITAPSTETGGFKSVKEMFDSVPCDHLRAYMYYTEAISNQNCTFWGRQRTVVDSALSIVSGGRLTKELVGEDKCTINSCLPFGLKSIDFPARGSFEVETSSSSPFCIHEEKVDDLMNDMLKSYKTEGTVSDVSKSQS